MCVTVHNFAEKLQKQQTRSSKMTKLKLLKPKSGIVKTVGSEALGVAAWAGLFCDWDEAGLAGTTTPPLLGAVAGTL